MMELENGTAKCKKYQRTIFLPNSSPVPNWFFDFVLAEQAIPHGMRSVFLFMLRKTIGWDHRVEEISLNQIQDGSAVTRHTAIHAIRVICDCWGLFHKTRGRKGQYSSVYTIVGFSEEQFSERYFLVEDIYGTGCPTAKQLREKPCSKELIEHARAVAERNQR
ncbi:MAG: hypothetical protein ACRD4S_01700 [Candidatus Acidiferrales bacterium]